MYYAHNCIHREDKARLILIKSSSQEDPMKKNLQKKCFTTILLTFIEFSLIKKLSFRLTYARPPAAQKILNFFFPFFAIPIEFISCMKSFIKIGQEATEL